MTFRDSIAPSYICFSMASVVQRVRVCSLCRDAVDHSPFWCGEDIEPGLKELFLEQWFPACMLTEDSFA